MIGVGTTIFLVRPQTFASGASYLLDTYSASAAYSLRQLKTGVTNVVRVRRSSDSAESDFTADEVTDGTLTTWTGANDGFVVTLYDQQGSNNATQSTAASQPQIVSSGSLITVNSKPLVRFDGSNDYLEAYNNTSTSGFIFGVSNSRTTNSTSGISKGTVATDTFALQFAHGATNKARFISDGADVVASGTSTTNQQSLVTGSSNGTTWSMWINGGSETLTPSAGTNNGDWFGDVGTANILFGALQQTGSKIYWDSDIQEVIIYDSDESANRTDIESDINTHYSIY